MTRLSEEYQEPFLKTTMEEIKNLMNTKTFLSQDPEKVEPVTPCMNVFKAKFNLTEVLTN